MDTLSVLLSKLLASTPDILALIVSLSGIGLAAFALYVVHVAHHKERRRK